MGITINVADDANVELDDVDITIYGDSIAFSVDGEITDVPRTLNEFAGNKLTPVEITFERNSKYRNCYTRLQYYLVNP